MRVNKTFNGCEQCKANTPRDYLKAMFTCNVERIPFPEQQMTGFKVNLNILFVCKECHNKLTIVRTMYHKMNGTLGKPIKNGSKMQPQFCLFCHVDLFKQYHKPSCPNFNSLGPEDLV